MFILWRFSGDEGDNGLLMFVFFIEAGNEVQKATPSL